MIANLTKQEYLHPHKLGTGLKLWEICANPQIGVLAYLLRKSDELGGGDIRDPDEFPNAGRWAGDSLVIIGDYDSSELYYYVQDHFKEITDEIKDEYNAFIEIERLMIGRERL